jgi:hypothetical protein
VNVANVTCDCEVVDFVQLVNDNEKQVKTGHDWACHVDVGAQRLGAVVASVDGVGSSEHRRAGVECRLDACLCDRDGLLLHRFVNRDLGGRGRRCAGERVCGVRGWGSVWCAESRARECVVCRVITVLVGLTVKTHCQPQEATAECRSEHRVLSR